MDAIRDSLVQNGLDPSLAPLMLGLIALQLALQVAAFIDLARRPHVTLGDRKWAWAIIILFGQLLGSILYFALGRVKYAPGEHKRSLVDMDLAEEKAQAIVDKLYGPKES